MSDKEDQKEFALDTREAVHEFIEEFAEDVRKGIFAIHGVPFCGAVLATRDERGNALKAPVPAFVGYSDLKGLRKRLRKGVLALCGEGALLVHNEGRRVVFQLEHRRFGEKVWFATIDDSMMLGRLQGPFDLETVEVKPLIMLPERYMS